MRITSVQNPQIKAWSLLKERKARMEAGAFLVEGTRLVETAISAGAPLLHLLVDEANPSAYSAMKARHPLPEPVWVSAHVLEKLSDTKNPQSVMAIVELPDTATGRHTSQDWSQFFRRARHVLVLERVQDPGNVGTMIRAADACGFDAVVLTTDSADPWQPKVLRATMGSIWHIPVLLTEVLMDVLASARQSNLKVVAAHPRHAIPAHEADMANDILLVVGNEASGLSDEMLESADRTVMIPMVGEAESLNVASAASMLLYESMRQRLSPPCQ